MSELLKTIDARTKLAGTNKLEILMFSLGTDSRTGRRETYGINVFKVREVMRTPEGTRAPEMPSSVEGMVSLRGNLVPVVDLAKYAGIPVEAGPQIMIVTEYNGHTQGFLVEAVDTILTDPRIQAIVAGVPFASDFDLASLARPVVPLGIVQAEQDRWLVPKFHSMPVIAACQGCETIASLPTAGHGALLAPLPPDLDNPVGRLLADPPGFDRAQLPALYLRITSFFDKHLLP